MTSKTINFNYSVAGILTDVTSVFLRDATNTYGLRRADDLTLVIAPGTALNHDGTGLYSITAMGLTEGVIYQYAVEWAYAGSTDRQVITFTAPSTNPVSGYYTNQTNMANFIGADNLVAWSNRDITNPIGVNTDIVLDALQRTDRYLDRQFRINGYTTPIVLASADFGVITDLATEYAVVLLYMGRPESLTDEGQDIAGKMQKHLDRFNSGLNDLISHGIDGDRSATDDHGITVIPACPQNPYGLPGPRFA